MTTPAPPDPLPAELLAAYADGELDAETRAAVERWLRDHPEAFEELAAQRALSPLNAVLWEHAAPPQPPEDAWAAVEQNVADAMLPLADEVAPPGRGWRVAGWLVGGLSVVGAAAAAVGWLAFGPVAPQRQPHDPQPVEVVQPRPVVAPEPRPMVVAPSPRVVDPLAGYPVLAMATDDDVVLSRVPEFPAGWLPVGRHPFSGFVILASEDELFLAGVGPSPAWPPGGPKMTTAPGDAPMIFAPKPR